MTFTHRQSSKIRYLWFQTIKRPVVHIDEKLEMAELRRKAAEEEKVKTVLERSGIDKQNRIR